MALDLKQSDHKNLDKMLDAVLQAFKNNEVSLSQARETIAHVFTAAAIDNRAEIDTWLDPNQIARWIKECHATRT
jgi:hypothetical protein